MKYVYFVLLSASQSLLKYILQGYQIMGELYNRQLTT